jgi:geranylgeranyl reductase family protein
VGLSVAEFDALVVGAGPAGSVAAAILAKEGLRVALLERAAAPHEKICGEYVGPRAVADLERLGFGEALRGVATRRLDGMAMVVPDGTVVESAFVTDAGAAAHGLSVARALLDGALQQEARRRGAQLSFERAVTAVEFGRDGVVVHAGEPWRARWLIGADGRFSLVARACGLAVPAGSDARPRQRGVIHAWLRNVADVRDRGEMHLLRDGAYLGLDPLADGRLNAGLVVDVATVAAAVRDQDGGARLLAAAARSPALAPRFRAAQVEGEVRYLAPMTTAVRAVASGRALLVGDAAGFVDPLTGEGIALAIASGELAARAIVQALRAGDRPEHARAAAAAYARDHARLVRGKRWLHPLLQALLRRPALADRIGARLTTSPAAAQRLLAVISNLRPPSALLHPEFWAPLLARPRPSERAAHAQ